MQLAVSLLGLTQIVQGGVDGVQRDVLNPRKQQPIHVQLGELLIDIAWFARFPTGFPVDDREPLGIVLRIEATIEDRVKLAVDDDVIQLRQ